ncbi:ligand-gated ion channel subunit [Aphelenchoides avenae]|nr:ligand-gated ion channel subunit [Aphelenchus avenae]
MHLFDVLIGLTCVVLTRGELTLRERLMRNPKAPPKVGNEPLRVMSGIYIESMGKFKAEEMAFDVDLYLYSTWRDPSLNHSNPDHVLISDYKVKDHIWMPDLYFSNARTSKFHDVTVPNFSLFIAQDGTIAYSSRVTLTVACNLKLEHYPMDQQKCSIRTLSYAHIASVVNITWFPENAIRYNPEIDLPEFIISDVTHGYCDGTYMYAIMENSYRIDAFSCLEAVIHLRRAIGYHIVQSFVPTGLIVMISWVSFWIDRRAVPARVTLSFTTLLSLSTLGNGMRFGLPQVSYAKSIDLWFGACMFFVFASLLEYAIINSYMRQADKYEKLAQHAAKRDSDDSLESHQTQLQQKESVLLFDHPRIKIVDNGVGSPNQYSIYNDYTEPPKSASLSKFPIRAEDIQSGRSSVRRREANHVDSFRPIDDWFPDEDDTKKVPLRRTPSPPSRSHCHCAKKDAASHDAVGNPIATTRYLKMAMLYSRKALKIDKYSRVGFPVAFCMFNVFYWSYYLWYVQLS